MLFYIDRLTASSFLSLLSGGASQAPAGCTGTAKIGFLIKMMPKGVAFSLSFLFYRRKAIFHMRTLSPADRICVAWIFLMGFVDLLYTAFLMPVLIVFPTNNTVYYWGSAVNLVLGGQSATLLCGLL